MKTYSLHHFALCLLLAISACTNNDARELASSEEIQDSLKTNPHAVFLELPEQNLVIYRARPAEQEEDAFDYHNVLNVLHTITGQIDTIRWSGNEYVTNILKGRTEETVSVISCDGGSRGYCYLSVIDLREKKEILCKDLETNFFHFEDYIPEGYKGTCYIRTYDERYSIGFNTAIDYEGNTIFMEEIDE